LKIHIIGGSGTGKSFIADKISSLYHIPHFDLDDIFWDNTAAAYNTKMPVERRTVLLNEILATDAWVIEGVFCDWLRESFSAADRIFVLKAPQLLCDLRIIRRFIKRKLGLQKGKKETLRSLYDLLVRTNRYQKRRIPEILAFLGEYGDKVMLVKNSNEILKYIGGSSRCK